MGTPVSGSTNNLDYEAEEKLVPKEQFEEHIQAKPLHAASMSPTHITKVHVSQTESVASLAGDHTKSLYTLNKLLFEAPSAEAQFLATLVPVGTAKSAEGVIEFKDLFIPPPPAPKLSLPASDGQTQRLAAPSQDKGKKELNPSPLTSAAVVKTMTLPAKASPCASPWQLSIDETLAAQGSGLLSPGARRSSLGGCKASKKSPLRKGKLTEKEKLLQGRREKLCLLGKCLKTLHILTTFKALTKELLTFTYIHILLSCNCKNN